MRKVINGKLYDTDAAELLHDWESGHNTDDFDHRRERLYRTKNGRLFLFGLGGPSSKYAQAAGGNSWYGGEAIEPMTAGQAVAWLEDHGGDEAIVAEFPSFVEEA